MLTYEEYRAFSVLDMGEEAFGKMEPRVVTLLSSLCGDAWDAESEDCKRAVAWQLEYISQKGGPSSWSAGSEGSVQSRSWAVGGESESVSYGSAASSSRGYTWDGLEVSPLALAVLRSGGFCKTVAGVRVW